jgi:23S rRNA (cytosine1962-C5)-methyltransferase
MADSKAQPENEKPFAVPFAERVPTVHLRKGSAKPLYGGHPWIFADAIARLDGPKAESGCEVRVVDDQGACLGRGFYSPESAIPVRLLTRADAAINDEFLETRITEALRLRREVLKLGVGVVAQASLPASLPNLSEKDRTQLENLDKQLANINAFAAQYGMDAMEETAELRKRRDELLKSAGIKTTVAPTVGSLLETTAWRAINSEGDGLGGLTVDVYGDCLSIQLGTAGMDRRSAKILDILEAQFHPAGIVDRSDAKSRQIEKLSPPKTGPLRGKAPSEPFFVREYGLEMICDLRSGKSQKTGLYLDQRENRRHVAGFAAGRHVLDVFSYSGGFALHCAKAQAKSITLIESSEEALELAKTNLERNGIEDADLVNAEWTEGFKHLREAGKQFDLIVLDPPKFARGRDVVAQAISGYRDLNAQAVRLLAPGGLLFTCSCSGSVSETDFERAVASGIRSSGRRAVLLERRGAAMDHPVPPGFDQGRYLKGLLLQVV